ncbi:hypothetical protein AX774_g1263 [Zancudomyces culisetae]|uniref:Uncharacterized protein n=1 Tax=Zancudomyces culisetae TaxID=1213189 RepID=A0A1R1PWD2_ZANCU|nr:hypothetical protein AX774_g1263 [Zancudomyces culisetae]|eukprot:OMH85202.1 hypothetical protein AX774_g1263 [Zancudomyces culisetae]
MNAFFNHIKTLIHTKSYTYSLEPSEVNDNRNEKKTGTESAKSDQPKILASTNMDDKSTTSNSTTKPCITNVSLDPLQENRSHEHGQDGYEDKKRTRMSKLSLFLANKKCKDK